MVSKLELTLVQMKEIAENCNGQNRVYDSNQNVVCTLRKGTPKFNCKYLQSNPISLIHYCSYKK